MDRSDADPALTPGERAELASIRAAGSLAELAAVVGVDSEHEAYLRAGERWSVLRGRELAAEPTGTFPGASVTVDGHDFHVHGVTHAGTDAEGEFLRDHVAEILDRGGTVYCEQGIRSMYFAEMAGVCEMDDYRWAMAKCRELDVESHVSDLEGSAFAGVAEDLDSLAGRFREAAFSLIDSGGEFYGEWVRQSLGDFASAFLVTHEGLATGDDFEAFSLTDAAASDPGRLAELQRYYERRMLPQPIEREWLRRHDRELEIVTHARNERMADYALYHNEDAEEVHLIVGAAHQPGVRYYLERFRDGERELDFQIVA